MRRRPPSIAIACAARCSRGESCGSGRSRLATRSRRAAGRESRAYNGQHAVRNVRREGPMTEGVRLYAGTHEGMFVYRSRVSGWEEVSRALPGAIVDSIVGCQRRPERIFAGVAHDGLYRTVDASMHWAKVLDGDIRSVAIDATDEVIYAGTEPVHLYRK